MRTADILFRQPSTGKQRPDWQACPAGHAGEQAATVEPVPTSRIAKDTAE